MPTAIYQIDHSEFKRCRTYHLYAEYVKSLSGRKNNPYAVSMTDFTDIISRFHGKVRNAMLHRAYIFKMPYMLGTLYVEKRKQKYRYDKDGNIDPRKSNLFFHWPKYKALTQEERKNPKKVKSCYVYNTHTGGYKFNIHWGKKGRRSNVKNLSVYRFRANKPFRKQAIHVFNTLYPKGEVDYFERKF